jgi:hypothetical protein
MPASRKLFISYTHTPNYEDKKARGIFGFGDVEVDVDFAIKNRADLIRALMKGLEEKGVTGKMVIPLNWHFYEE